MSDTTLMQACWTSLSSNPVSTPLKTPFAPPRCHRGG